MTDPSTLIETAAAIIRARYAEDPKLEAPPFVIGLKEGSPVLMVELKFDNEFMKSMSVMATKQVLLEKECDASLFLSEAWMTNVNKDEYDSENVVPPSESPDRIEVLMIEASTSGRFIMATFTMVRDAEGGLADLVPRDRFDTMVPNDTGMVIAKSRFDFFGGLQRPKGATLN